MSKLNQYQKNQIIEVTCNELSYEGLGVTRNLDGYAIFTSDLFPGEIAQVQLLKVNSKFAFAKVIKLLVSSPARNKEQEDCINSAPLINLNYQEQVKFKDQYLSKLLSWNLGSEAIKKYISFQASPIIYNYRNKVRYPFIVLNNQIYVGEYDIKSNNLHLANNFSQNKEAINKVLDYILDIFNNYYPINKKQEHLRFYEEITLRSNEQGEISLALKINSDYDIPSKLLAKIQFYSAIVDFNIIKKDNVINLFNKKPFAMSLNNMQFNCNIKSFFQINSQMAEMIFAKINEIVAGISSQVILDAYCGVGVIGQLVAGSQKQIVGSDIAPSSIIDARINSKHNKVNAKYYIGDSGTVFKKQVTNLQNTILILDPPRSGLTTEFIDWIKRNKIENIVYMSCDPKTLVRDLKDLSLDYSISYIQGFDMFPNTAHIETVVLLQKLK
ncbi:23S rRNA (uracil(1939)-C(5))-methyltransferase RlmD [Mycoplasma sp. 1932B]|uniref:23S rRNA (uracil(1939)-C(5))-methyltransferase RlmD n=1 Tax=Mycoplasma sp. 1932B TaxID=3401670 RepID=UPI003AB01727